MVSSHNGTANGAGSASTSARASPAVGSSSTANKGNSNSSKQTAASLQNGHPTSVALSAMKNAALDLSTVERRGQPTAVREPVKKKSRPHDLEEAPTYTPNEEEWKNPMAYIQKISEEASKYGICKIIPPASWNPDFAIDTEKFHFRTRKQELNSVEGSTRANRTYLDALEKFHKQHGTNLHRLPYVDKKPLDLYKLKKAVEARGGFDKVCKHKKWAEIGRDLGYSGKIMSSLSTSLKNSYQKWLCPYEEYLRLAKPGVHQQLEMEYGGPLTPSPAQTPLKKSTTNTPAADADSPAIRASDALNATLSTSASVKEEDGDATMTNAPPARKSTGFRAINTSGFTAVNSGFTSVNKAASDTQGNSNSLKPPGSPKSSTKGTPLPDIKRRMSVDSDCQNNGTDKEDSEGGSRRSKRLKKENVPTVAGSHMSFLRPCVPRNQRDETAIPGENCETCGKDESAEPLFVCDSCDHAYHGSCLDPPLKTAPHAEWNCPRCLVGDGQFGFEEGGLYSLKQFQQKAADFKQGYFERKMPIDLHLGCARPVTEEDVENEFWRLVADIEETVEVEYGADIHCTTHGSGFPTIERHPTNPYSYDPWNLNIMPLGPDSLFRHIKTDISGMTVPWVYVGMIFSTFCWHNEDHYAYSANFQHFGATKTWYGIPASDAEKFELAMREAVPELFETQPDLLFQLVTLLTPEQLKKAGVKVYALDQRAGQFVITFPQAYHAGFNHGFNFNEAVNFAPCDWEPFGLAGVERLQAFRRQPCFSHDELLWTAAEGAGGNSLSIQTAKWLAPALKKVQTRELELRESFLLKHLEASPHSCPLDEKKQSESGSAECRLQFIIEDVDVPEDEYACVYCKAFSYFSRYKCVKSGKVVCLLHAGSHACCEATEEERLTGADHILYYRKTAKELEEAYQKVADKAAAPDQWEEKYNKMLEDEAIPSIKNLKQLLHEGERIPHDLPSLPLLKEFVDRCNDWIEEANNYIGRKQQNRRKSDRVWSGKRQSVDETNQKDHRDVQGVYRLLEEAKQIGFECSEIAQLQERSATIQEFRVRVAGVLKAAQAPGALLDKNIHGAQIKQFEDLMEEGRGFNVDIPEVDSVERELGRLRWNEKAQADRLRLLTLGEVTSLIVEGERLDMPRYNDHLTFYRLQREAGESWEKKANELISAESVHYAQLEALSSQVQSQRLPVNPETLARVDQILAKQREAYKQIAEMNEMARSHDPRDRPRYSDAHELTKRLEELNCKPSGSVELDREVKRHEDWMRKGKKLFGKANAPLHILKTHLEYVLERNIDCFDIVHDKPRDPAEPASREPSPESKPARWEDPASREVFCICRRVEAGMMIECGICHEWYHGKCLKIARGKVKDDEQMHWACPICDHRVKIPRDAARPKLEDLMAWRDEIPMLPFQPDETDLLNQIIDNASAFREHISGYINPAMSSQSEAETQRFYLRKVEGAEVLLVRETNFLRQELYKWCRIAPEPPTLIEDSKSTRKPRPTKLQKMLNQYGVEDPDDLPEEVRGKASSLRRKLRPNLPPHMNGGGHMQSYISDPFRIQTPGMLFNASASSSHDNSTAPELSSASYPKTLEERLVSGLPTDLNLSLEQDRKRALEILARSTQGRRRAEEMFGPEIWSTAGGMAAAAAGSPLTRPEPLRPGPGPVRESIETTGRTSGINSILH
ncbi:hypothetical protein TD95_003683 [Thielaviopsis punctulata]|uniref:Uncharacterized protein n=1 Tax=Thielaviopsis punctulata TaxID=72032 RepID=A0A0F4Z8V2_9PEZI|nr:hypothetical protein TD95_003683 [Thielaviopsis punctulata]